MIGALIFLLIGLFLLIIGLVYFFKGKNTETWKPIVGRIIDTKLGARYSHDSGGSSGMSYQTMVEYEYDSFSGNKILRGNKVAIGYMPTGKGKEHTAIRQKLQSSNQVKLWVNPKDETQSVICKGTNQYAHFFIVFGAMLMLFALSMLPFKEEKKSTPGKILQVEIIEYKTIK